ncbi:MAG: hypothetical protein AAF480_08465 [Actinomycetota bacterium]
MRHPSKRRLLAWLEVGDDSLDAHMAGCDRCASRLEDLSQPATAIGDALRTMLAPPEDLQPRLRVGIARRMQNREDMRLLFELLGVPWQTARAMSAPRPEDDRT